MLESQPLTAGFHASLIVPLARPGKAWLEQVVTDQRLETLGELREKPHPAFHRRRKIIVNYPPRQAIEMSRRPDMAIEEGQLVTGVIEPDEVASRIR